MATDPNRKYVVVGVTRKSPNQGITAGKLILRKGLADALGLSPSAAEPVTFSAPFNKASFTRKTYPGDSGITVAAATGVVTTKGRVGSLLGGESWTITLASGTFGIRVINVRAEDLQEALKGATGISEGAYFTTAQGGKYPIKDPVAP